MANILIDIQAVSSPPLASYFTISISTRKTYTCTWMELTIACGEAEEIHKSIRIVVGADPVHVLRCRTVGDRLKLRLTCASHAHGVHGYARTLQHRSHGPHGRAAVGVAVRNQNGNSRKAQRERSSSVRLGGV